jgi:hypothetical protein
MTRFGFLVLPISISRPRLPMNWFAGADMALA